MTSLAAALLVLALAPDGSDAPRVDFNREVLPILAEHCFTCHGPDEGTREGDLRLDVEQELYKPVARDLWVVKPGDLKRSELWYRVSTDDEYEVMPPFWSDDPPLTDAEQATLQRWIEEGAEWTQHWAYIAPERPPIDGDAHPVDALLGLAADAAAGPAEPAKLMRRASLDLTGLPPSVEELDAFLADTAPGAYGRLIERLLASPHYGEQRARRWLDLARYADTHGYEKDGRRTMWRYRDWVINAFNDDMPFDRFTVEQLAGDLLEHPTTAQRIATGFHRNTMVNAEGGTDPEEFRVAAVVDRVNTTGSVWLGSTLACAQCHTHKYDPFTHREYYGLFGFFNSTADVGNSAAPVLSAPLPDDERRLARLEAELARIESRLTAPDDEMDFGEYAWERRIAPALAPPASWRQLEPAAEVWSSQGGATLTRAADRIRVGGERAPTDVYDVDARLAGGGRITALRIDALQAEQGGPVGRADDGNFVLTGVELTLVSANGEERALRLAGAEADFEQSDARYPALHAIDADAGSGWAVSPEVRAPHVATFALAHAVELAPDDRIRVRLRQEHGASSWLLGDFRLAVTDDEAERERLLLPAFSPWRSAGPLAGESGKALYAEQLPEEREALAGEVAWDERPDWIDARVHTLDGENSAFVLTRTITSERGGPLDLLVGSDDSVRVYLNGESVHANKARRGAARGQDTVRVELPPGESRLVMKVINYGGPGGFAFEARPAFEERMPRDVAAALAVPRGERSSSDAAVVRAYFRREVSELGRGLVTTRDAARTEADALRSSLPTTMVMRELDAPRETRILQKGSFLSPGEPVEPHVPEVLHDFPADAPRNRLGLARWLVAPENPLTARVVVNRVWEELFGIGLVETSDDFGTRGEPPVNQALLDWLAVELIESGWSLKALYRTLLASDAYQRDSAVTPAALAADPANRGGARGPRHRLSAETIRDNALAIAGLLSDRIGGPSAFPPQPEGIWAATYNNDRWTNDEGEGRYRRGLYTFLRRTAPYPTFAMFDATSREVVCTRRARTNTPLQALAALNDPAFLEAAGGLALRMLAAPGAVDDGARLAYGFRLCVARAPEADELEVLAALLDAERARFAAPGGPERAAELDAAALPFESDRADAPARAPWIVVANALLNLDETLTKD
ncbi:MAG: PSD1 and planctomycete cytochrome C domain-containing protein [Planctomycetota bacterium]